MIPTILKLRLTSIVLLLGLLVNPVVSQIVHYNLREAFDDERTISLSEIAKEIEYIKLETTNNCLIGHTNRIFLFNNNLLVAYDKIYAFDSLGKFRKVVAEKGKGPGEYIEFRGIDIDTKTGHSYLHSLFGKSLLHFDDKNNFLGNIGNQNGDRVLKFDETLFCNYFPTRDLAISMFYSLVFMDEIGESNKRMLKRDENINNNLLRMSGQNSRFYRYQDSLTIWDGFNDTIIRISQDYNITPKFILDLGKEKLPFIMKTGKGSREHRKEEIKYSYIYDLVESSRFIFLSCVQKGKVKNLICNKSTGQCYCINFPGRISNDFDGGYSFWPQGVTSDGRLYFVIDMTFFKTHFEKDKNIANNITLKYQKIKKMIDDSDENDNPVIMLVTLK